MLAHGTCCSEASHTFSRVNSPPGTSLFPQHSTENQISGSPTSIKKSPVLRPACHATPPSSTDSKYCKAGKAGVGVNSSIGVSALKINTTLKKENYGVLANTTWLQAYHWPFWFRVKKWWVLEVRLMCLTGAQDAGDRVQPPATPIHRSSFPRGKYLLLSWQKPNQAAPENSWVQIFQDIQYWLK